MVGIFCKEAYVLTTEELIINNQALVYAIAKKYYYLVDWSHQEDIVQEGMEGLVLAANRYEPSKGFRFSTFAYHYIQGHMRRFVREKIDIIRTPRKSVVSSVTSDGTTVDTLVLDSYRNVAAYMASEAPLKLDTGFRGANEEDTLPLAELIADPNQAILEWEKWYLIELVQKRAKELLYSSIDQQIFEMHFIEGVSVNLIAKKFDISRQAIYIRIKKIRNILKDDEILKELLKTG